MAEYGVFIIESVGLDEEDQGLTDGFILKQILDMCGIENKYYYIRTKQELKEIINLFEESELRYLHLSCHGNATSIGLSFDTLTYKEFGEIVGDKLSGRRLFLSCCQASNQDFAKEIIPKYKCQSVVGTPDSPGFAQSAVFWSGFYYKMSKTYSEKMLQDDILNECKGLSSVFDMPINYYSFIRRGNKFLTTEIREHIIMPNQDPVSSIVYI
jgi:hypothetical protein